MTDDITFYEEENGAKHSTRGPSSANRWINCTISPQVIEKLPRERQSGYAAEGQAAHAVGAHCLVHNEDGWEHDGELVQPPGSEHPPFMVDDEMRDGVQLYLDFVRGLMKKWAHRNPILLVEQRVASPEHDDAFGTADTILIIPPFTRAEIEPLLAAGTWPAWDDGQGRLIVPDLKYGKGIIVEPDDEQVRLYGHYSFETYMQWKDVFDYSEATANGVDIEKAVAAGQMKDPDALLFPDPNTICQLYIVQPRAFHPKGPVREHVTTKHELARFFYGEALPAMEESHTDAAHYEMGSWCRLCPNNLTCVALNGEAQNFKAGSEPIALTDDQLGDELNRLQTLFIPREKKLEAEAFRRAMAGRAVPHFKLVRQIAHRIWKQQQELMLEDGSKVLVKLVDALVSKYGVDGAYEPAKLLSPAKIEKLPDGKNFAKTWGMQPQTGLTLAPETDRRAAQKSDMDAVSEADGFVPGATVTAGVEDL